MAFVIGAAAQSQMGKDTLADRLQLKLNQNILDGDSVTFAVWERDAFAANVKKVFEDTFGVDRAFVEEWKTKDEVPPGFDMPVRKGLQFIGDGFRMIRETIWLDLCFRDSIPKIISDVRYVNEFTRVKKEGGLNILIGRPDKLNDDPNGSEAMIRPFCEWALENTNGKFVIVDRHVGVGAPVGFNLFDVFIRNDGTKEEFYEVIDKQLVPFVEKFVFDFPEPEPEPEEPKEKECLISN